MEENAMQNNGLPNRKNRFTRSTLDATLNKIYDYIVIFINQTGYPPSVRDICTGTGIKSTSTVHAHLKRLKESGKLDYTTGRRRAISLTSNPSSTALSMPDDHKSDNTIHLPLIGHIAAGAPILATENIECTLPFPSDFFANKGDCFALKVHGDSMIHAAILDGDYVIVRKQNTASQGDIVVALINDEATVKTLVKIDNKLYLKPENPKYDLIPFQREECHIQGKVIGVFRHSV
jgi:repressor LexA